MHNTFTEADVFDKSKMEIRHEVSTSVAADGRTDGYMYIVKISSLSLIKNTDLQEHPFSITFIYLDTFYL